MALHLDCEPSEEAVRVIRETTFYKVIIWPEGAVAWP